MARIFFFLLIATCCVQWSVATNQTSNSKREKVGDETVIWQKSQKGTTILAYLESGKKSACNCIPLKKLKKPETVKYRIKEYIHSREVTVQRDSLITLFGRSLELTTKVRLLESRKDNPVTLDIKINSEGKIIRVVFVMKQENMGLFTSEDICSLTKTLVAKSSFSEPSRSDLDCVSLAVPIYKKQLVRR